MVNYRLAISAVIAIAAIAIPAYGATVFFGWAIGAIVAIGIAIGIGGGRYLAAQRSGASTGSANRGRARRSKGASGRER